MPLSEVIQFGPSDVTVCLEEFAPALTLAVILFLTSTVDAKTDS